MIPNKEDFLEASCRWNGEHRGIRYELSWHSLSKYNEQGTWCYYISVTDEQFYPEDWERLRLAREDKQMSGAGSWWRHWNYEDFPDLKAHGGWTFGEMDTFLGKDGKEHEHVKVGCDYAHSFDRDGGYWQGRKEVEQDCKRSIDLLIEMFPNRRERCQYSGMWDNADKFYTAVNGSRVHISQKDKFDDGWAAWRPADAT